MFRTSLNRCCSLVLSIAIVVVTMPSLATYVPSAHAAANITLGSASLAADGVTITATISGGSGSGYSPASDITGITARITTNGAPRYPIASTSIAGSTLTITLRAFVASSDTLVLDISSSSNLTDSGGNSAQGQTSIAVTNSSAKSVTRFSILNSAITVLGRLGPLNSGYRQFYGPRTETVVRVTGTDCTAFVFGGQATGLVEVSVDGAAFSGVTLVTTNAAVIIPVFSGLSDTAHTVIIRRKVALDLYGRESNYLQVAGSSPSLSAAGVADGFGPNFVLLDEPSYFDLGSWPSVNLFSTFPNTAGGSFNDLQMRVRGSGSMLKAWSYAGTGTILVEEDDVEISRVTLTGGGVWDLRTLASGLDGEDHLYTITFIGPYTQTEYIDSLMFVGTGASFSSIPVTARTGIGGYGDSITEGGVGGLASDQAYIFRLADRFDYTPYNRAVASTTVETYGDSNTSTITGISPELDKVFILYGTNDMGVNVTPTSAFGTSYQAMLTSLLSGTTDTKYYVMGILPKSGAAASTITAWNGSGNGVQGSIDAVQSAMPDDADRLIYIDTSTFQMNGSSGTDYATNYLDGLHLNAAGYVIMEKYLAPYAAGTGYTITGSSSGDLGEVSSTFTVALASGGEFDGSDTITLSDGGGSGTFIPSVGSTGTGTVTVTPSRGATGFTFTYTPSHAGSRTITSSNSEGWTDYSALSYSVSKATATASLVSNTNPSTVGNSITLTATVEPSSATGTVTFFDGGTTLGSETLVNGSAAFNTSGLTVGTHSLTVVYNGNSDYLSGTSSTLSQVVNAASSSNGATTVARNQGRGGGGGGRRSASVSSSAGTIDSPFSTQPRDSTGISGKLSDQAKSLLLKTRERLVMRIEKRIAEHPSIADFLRRILKRLDDRIATRVR